MRNPEGTARATGAPPPQNGTNDLYDRLPDYVKEELAEQEYLHDLRLRDINQRRRATRTRYLLEGMVIFTLAGLFGGPVGWAIGALYGTGVGYLAWRQGGSSAFLWVSVLAYMVWFLLTPWGDFYFGFFCMALSAIVAAVHRMNKFDGSEC